jgi:CRISPR/Cas system-associated exonuclease Cas4 (RecB family)
MRRPHPAGRAFLALLSCAADNVSARRFAEYLSLGQVPDATVSAASDAFPTSLDEIFGPMADRAELRIGHTDAEEDAASAGSVGMSRAPWRWERLLADSRVIVGCERWERRLKGRIQEFELQRRELARTEPDSPRLDQLKRRVADLAALRHFALPIVRTLSSWPARATWAEWLDALEQLAPRVLSNPDHVLRVLADLRPMAAIGPIDIQEVATVLADRLATIEAEPPARRYGRVFVASPTQLRGRRFDVVFIPALAERMFPQKTREDPLLLDDRRRALSGDLPTQSDRAEAEKLHLRIAVGAAAKRLFVSFPTVEVGEGRQRVPSLYALEVWRAMTGDVPGADELQQAAARASRATLAWPAPEQADEAIDSLEHDLATLGALAGEPDDRARGRAQYILQLNDALQRSVRERYMRSRSSWSHWDGLTRVTERTAAAFERQRLGTRPYSLSALQRFSQCPYQFLLGAIYRLRPAEDLEPLQRLDPLTRGSLFHAMQTSFYRRMKASGKLPLTVDEWEHALAILDESVEDVGAQYRELLAPAIERVWNDEIAAIRRDLRLWIDEVVRVGGEWAPLWFEWSFGLDPPGTGGPDSARDPESASDPVTIDGRFLLRGSIDLVEVHATTGELRVTDHKTGKYRGKHRMVVGGGTVLQPVLYGLALEEATGRPVVEGRLYYATAAGGYRDVSIKLTPEARRAGVEVLEVIDRSIASGFLAPSPAEKACSWCDFRPVCGPTAEHRIGRYKSPEPLADLVELRRRP